jgi:hypothetical protein
MDDALSILDAAGEKFFQQMLGDPFSDTQTVGHPKFNDF